MSSVETKWGNDSLEASDKDVFDLANEEKERQRGGLCLIASENFASKAVMEATGTHFTNKYAEGYPGRRYYGGTAVCDKLERLCQERALAAFGLSAEEWGVNVQAYSGSPANFAVYTGLLRAHDRMMGLDLPSGGHLTHGFRTAGNASLTASSKYFESMPYRVSSENGLIDYDEMERSAALFRPNLIIAGGSAYPQEWDYARMRKLADEHKAYLMADIAHISGLVLTKHAESPFEHCDVVTMTTHKTLRGPRGALIFYRLDKQSHLEPSKSIGQCIDSAIFPATQGGPHMNAIAGIAVALKEAMSEQYRSYIGQVCTNTKALCARLQHHGYVIVTGGSVNHLLLWNVRALGLTGSKVESALDLAGMYANKNSIFGDKSALTPGGIRLGTPCMTSRGFTEKDFEQVADFCHEATQIALDVQKQHGKLLKNFLPALRDDPRLSELRARVSKFTQSFPMPG